MFVASMRRMRVHATDHSCVSRSSASRFMQTFAVESSYGAMGLVHSRRARPFCEHRPKPLYGYCYWGSSDPLTRSQRVGPRSSTKYMSCWSPRRWHLSAFRRSEPGLLPSLSPSWTPVQDDPMPQAAGGNRSGCSAGSSPRPSTQRAGSRAAASRMPARPVRPARHLPIPADTGSGGSCAWAARAGRTVPRFLVSLRGTFP
jgi:hypothetical protein